jgi:hypothetical protein
VGGTASVPIYRLLRNSAFEPHHIEVMTAAFEAVCRDLQLAQREDALRDLVAQAIIECAQTGEFDPIKLRKCASDALKD